MSPHHGHFMSWSGVYVPLSWSFHVLEWCLCPLTLVISCSSVVFLFSTSLRVLDSDASWACSRSTLIWALDNSRRSSVITCTHSAALLLLYMSQLCDHLYTYHSFVITVHMSQLCYYLKTHCSSVITCTHKTALLLLDMHLSSVITCTRRTALLLLHVSQICDYLYMQNSFVITTHVSQLCDHLYTRLCFYLYFTRKEIHIP